MPSFVIVKDAPTTNRGLYEGNSLIKACGKMELLRKLLEKLKRDKHRVLIFSQVKHFNPFKPEFTIVTFIHYKPWIAIAILDLQWMKVTWSVWQMKKIYCYY